MNEEQYKRSISLNCPTCGGTQFCSQDESLESSSTVTCATCCLEISKEDLTRENQENIDDHLKELQEQATKDLQANLKKSLQDALKGSNFIKIK